MSQIFNFFPLSVLKSKINLTSDQKQKMIDEVFSMEKKSKNLDYKNQTSSWTGDTQGFEYLHNNPVFNIFFEEIKKKFLNI